MASDAELRSALEWESGKPQPADKNVFEWLWQAVQGDFDDNRSTGQIAFDTAISMIPVVDQICDVRDIIANSRAIATSEADEDTSGKWGQLVLSLVGLFPGLGSLVKGVLKLFFVFVRRYGLNKVTAAVDDAMTWVITYLRKREVQKQLRQLKVDEVFNWLAKEIKTVRDKVNTGTVLQAFDKSLGVMKGLLGKVADLPIVGHRAQATIEMVEKVRKGADRHIEQAQAPVKAVLDKIIHRLEVESLVHRPGILDARSVHFRGTLPEARAVTLMKQAEPPPSWLSKGRKGKWAEQDLTKGQRQMAAARKDDPKVPELSDTNIKSFHKMAVVEIKGPAKLYRVTSPSNGAMGDCWVPDDVWNKIMAAPDPKATWRKYSAVWPDWNPNGQFVVMEIPAGQSLKAWRGPASSQAKKDLPNRHLEGGWDQVVVKVDPGHFDTTRYYMRGGGHGEKLHPPGLTRQEWQKLSKSKRDAYTAMRERINHPNIKGPMDTGWGPTDFDQQLRDARIGLPALPGQVTN